MFEVIMSYYLTDDTPYEVSQEIRRILTESDQNIAIYNVTRDEIRMRMFNKMLMHNRIEEEKDSMVFYELIHRGVEGSVQYILAVGNDVESVSTFMTMVDEHTYTHIHTRLQ